MTGVHLTFETRAGKRPGLVSLGYFTPGRVNLVVMPLNPNIQRYMEIPPVRSTDATAFHGAQGTGRFRVDRRNRRIRWRTFWTAHRVARIFHNNAEKSNQTEFQYRLAWARTYLKKAGLIENSSRGVWGYLA